MGIKCKICNKEFEMNQGLSHHIKSIHNLNKKDYYDTYIKTKNDGICKTCGKLTTFISLTEGYRQYCSHSCVFLNNESLLKYKNTMKEKYGFEHYFQDQNTQNKIHQSNGYKNRKSSFTKPEVVQKISKIRNMKIKSFEQQNNCVQMKKIVNKYNSTAWKKLNLPILKLGKNSFIENKYLNKIDEFMKNWNIIKHKFYSKSEKYLLSKIKEFYKDKIIVNSRSIIKPYELDIYLPDLKLAIEYNGTYYHSIEMGISKTYHLQKSLLCKNLGIRLIHIYEFEDFNKQLNLLISLINGKDLYPKNDFNKNNLTNGLENIKPKLVKINGNHIYTVGKLL